MGVHVGADMCEYVRMNVCMGIDVWRCGMGAGGVGMCVCVGECGCGMDGWWCVHVFMGVCRCMRVLCVWVFECVVRESSGVGICLSWV